MTRSKKLHRRILPVGLTAAVLLALPALTITHDKTTAARGLVTQVVSLHPAANGLSHVSLKTVQNNDPAPKGFSDTGRSTSLYLELQ